MVVTAALFAPSPARAQDVTSAPLAAQLNVSTYVYWSDQHRYGCPPASLRVYVADYPGEQGGSSYQARPRARAGPLAGNRHGPVRLRGRGRRSALGTGSVMRPTTDNHACAIRAIVIYYMT
jgi:hypothetical protein